MAGEKVFIRKWFDDCQVFVGSVPEAISVKDVEAYMESHFGKVLKTEEVLPHEGAKIRMKHLYIQFQRDDDAEKCLFSSKKLVINDAELRVARAYHHGENE